MFRSITVAAVLSGALLIAGCATRGQVTRLEQQLQQLTAQTERLNADANRSAQRAEAAEAEARRAALRADEAARTADAIFAKRVAK